MKRCWTATKPIYFWSRGIQVMTSGSLTIAASEYGRGRTAISRRKRWLSQDWKGITMSCCPMPKLLIRTYTSNNNWFAWRQQAPSSDQQWPIGRNCVPSRQGKPHTSIATCQKPLSPFWWDIFNILQQLAAGLNFLRKFTPLTKLF